MHWVAVLKAGLNFKPAQPLLGQIKTTKLLGGAVEQERAKPGGGEGDRAATERPVEPDKADNRAL
jgi:hypothetical protein